jgi:hypothetical protein
MHRFPARLFLSLTTTLALAACGGGDPDIPPTAEAPALAADADPDANVGGDLQAMAQRQILAISDTQRASAATATARSSTNACSAIRPFYWEVGGRDSRLVSGSELAPGSTVAVKSNFPMSIASASKWIYGSYVAQLRGGQLSDTDRRFLTLRSGYVSLRSCQPTQTIDSCLATDGNGTYTPEFDGRFLYDGGHMQAHASLIGLGGKTNTTLATAIRGQIGTDVALSFSQPQVAGGAIMSPDAYALLLRKMLKGQLKIAALLGSGAVCTNASTCGLDRAVFAPLPATESWHYGAGHWVEDDPVMGDGAFSSPGAFGFYPWIDRSKSYYGVVARMAQNGAWPSVQCGRLIRKAWLSGVAQ